MIVLRLQPGRPHHHLERASRRIHPRGRLVDERGLAGSASTPPTCVVAHPRVEQRSGRSSGSSSWPAPRHSGSPSPPPKRSRPPAASTPSSAGPGRSSTPDPAPASPRCRSNSRITRPTAFTSICTAPGLPPQRSDPAPSPSRPAPPGCPATPASGHLAMSDVARWRHIPHHMCQRRPIRILTRVVADIDVDTPGRSGAFTLDPRHVLPRQEFPQDDRA